MTPRLTFGRIPHVDTKHGAGSDSAVFAPDGRVLWTHNRVSFVGPVWQFLEQVIAEAESGDIGRALAITELLAEAMRVAIDADRVLVDGSKPDV